jgi:hypothetical protein
LNDKSENWSVLGNENGVCLLQKKFVGVQSFIIAKNKKKTESKNKEAPRKTHSI